MTTLGSVGLRGDDGGGASFSVLAVFLLVMCSYTLVALESAYRDDVGCGEPSLERAEEVLEAFLSATLEIAMGEALPVAAMTPSAGPVETLDAVLLSLLREGMPSSAGGWHVELVEARCRQSAGAPGDRTLVAELIADLGDPDAGPSVRMGMSVSLPSSSWAELASRASSVVAGLEGGDGPVSQGGSGLLWSVAQERAFAGVDEVRDLLTSSDVEVALSSSLMALGRGEVPFHVPPPPVALGELVRQSVAGAVERELGWLEGYSGITLEDGLLATIRGAASEGISGAVLSVLEASTQGCLPVVEGVDLEDTVARGLSALDGIEDGLRSSDLPVLVSLWLDGLVPELPGAVKGHLVDGLTSWAISAAGLGVECAREALLALGQLGRQVDAWDVGMSVGPGGIFIRPLDLRVSTTWRGVKATEPPDLLAMLEGGEGLGHGVLPFTSTCEVSVEGGAEVTVTSEGVQGRSVRASWRVPVDLVWEVSVVTGRALEGVRYEPSATLVGDLARVSDAVWDRATGSVGWLTARFRDAAEAVEAWGGSLLLDMRGSLMTESAYTLSRALWKIGSSLVDNETGEALNGTWDLLTDLFGDDLREALTWEFDLLGSRVSVGVDPMRQQVLVSMSKGPVAVNLTVRRLCDPHPPFETRPVEGYHWGVFGEARLDREGRRAVLYLDPLTLERDSVLTMEVTWGEPGDGGLLVVEALEARRLGKGWSMSLSDLSGAGWLLSVAGGGMADAGLAVHGDLLEEGAARKALEGALKEAWLASMRGWKVGDLLGDTGKGPDAGTFLQTLLRELHAALVDRAGRLVSELEVFLEVAFPTPGWPSLRLSLVLVDPLDALLPLASWLRGSLEGLLGDAMSGSLEGVTRGLSTWLYEHLRVRFELAWEVAPPPWLSSHAGGAMPESLGLVVRGEANAAGLAALVGADRGEWSCSLEVILRGVPGAVLALVPGMGSTRWRWAEVTLVGVTVREVSAARLLLSQVLYDAAGTDKDLEYVELLNAGRRVLDLEGFRLRDDSGTFRVRGHVPVLPGGHVLVSRNSSAVRDRWGVLPDVGRMGLRLANDGDEVSLVDPGGLVLDRVAWEGHLPGWEGLEAGEGRALLRVPGDVRGCAASAWYVGEPVPRRTAW